GDIVDAMAETACGGQPRHPQAEQVFLLEEGKRPDERMPIMEDEHGTYILNSKDLRAIEHIGRLLDIGVDSLKIEGRTKSAYYVARVTQAYRRAIDNAAAGRDFDPALLTDLDGLAHRGYTNGFYQRHRPAAQNYASGQSESRERRYVGDIVAHDIVTGMAEVRVKNRVQTGDALEILHPSGNRLIRLERMESIDGQPLQEAPGDGWRIRIPLPGNLRGGMLARCL
ncbi:MAG TPA: U32 family peptidase, partial [Betaproteobacteria bacterium]|nr:U32 family peptidase [Betaproteobacteria bacterium]